MLFRLCRRRIYYLQPNTVGRHLRMGRPLFIGMLLAGHVRGGLSANEKEEKFALNDNVIYKKKSDFPCFF